MSLRMGSKSPNPYPMALYGNGDGMALTPVPSQAPRGSHASLSTGYASNLPPPVTVDTVEDVRDVLSRWERWNQEVQEQVSHRYLGVSASGVMTEPFAVANYSTAASVNRQKKPMSTRRSRALLYKRALDLEGKHLGRLGGSERGRSGSSTRNSPVSFSGDIVLEGQVYERLTPQEILAMNGSNTLMLGTERFHGPGSAGPSYTKPPLHDTAQQQRHPGYSHGLPNGRGGSSVPGAPSSSSAASFSRDGGDDASIGASSARIQNSRVLSTVGVPNDAARLHRMQRERRRQFESQGDRNSLWSQVNSYHGGESEGGPPAGAPAPSSGLPPHRHSKSRSPPKRRDSASDSAQQSWPAPPTRTARELAFLSETLKEIRAVPFITLVLPPLLPRFVLPRPTVETVVKSDKCNSLPHMPPGTTSAESLGAMEDEQVAPDDAELHCSGEAAELSIPEIDGDVASGDENEPTAIEKLLTQGSDSEQGSPVRERDATIRGGGTWDTEIDPDGPGASWTREDVAGGCEHSAGELANPPGHGAIEAAAEGEPGDSEQGDSRGHSGEPHMDRNRRTEIILHLQCRVEELEGDMEQLQEELYLVRDEAIAWRSKCVDAAQQVVDYEEEQAARELVLQRTLAEVRSLRSTQELSATEHEERVRIIEEERGSLVDLSAQFRAESNGVVESQYDEDIRLLAENMQQQLTAMQQAERQDAAERAVYVLEKLNRVRAAAAKDRLRHCTMGVWMLWAQARREANAVDTQVRKVRELEERHEKAMQRLREKITAAKQEQSGLKSQLEELRNERASLSDQVREQALDLKRLHAELSGSQADLQHHQADFARAQEKWSESCENLRRQLHQSQADHASLRAQHNELQEEAVAVRAALMQEASHAAARDAAAEGRLRELHAELVAVKARERTVSDLALKLERLVLAARGKEEALLGSTEVLEQEVSHLEERIRRHELQLQQSAAILARRAGAATARSFFHRWLLLCYAQKRVKLQELRQTSSARRKELMLWRDYACLANTPPLDRKQTSSPHRPAVREVFPTSPAPGAVTLAAIAAGGPVGSTAGASGPPVSSIATVAGFPKRNVGLSGSGSGFVMDAPETDVTIALKHMLARERQKSAKLMQERDTLQNALRESSDSNAELIRELEKATSQPRGSPRRPLHEMVALGTGGRKEFNASVELGTGETSAWHSARGAPKAIATYGDFQDPDTQ